MGSIGVPELILIFVVALLLFGPKKLPEIGRTIGKAMGEFRRATNDLQRSLEEEVAAAELHEVRREIRNATQAAEKTISGDLGGSPNAAAQPTVSASEPPAPKADSMPPTPEPAPPESAQTEVQPKPPEPK